MTELPPEAEKILGDIDAKSKRAADDWLAEFSKKSNEALAARAAAEKTTPRPDEQALVEALASKDHSEYDRVRSEVAKTLGVRVGTLDDKVAEVRKRRAKPEVLPPPDPEKLAAVAGDLLTEPDVLDRFGKAIEAAGLVGETNNAKILYLAITSRLFDRPVSVAVKGVSAGGKSFTVESVLKFFPGSAFFTRTGFSEKALYFSDEDFRHRFIVIFEAAGMESDYLSYVIRTLLSENRLGYELPVKTEEGMKPQVLEKEGPTGLITTTTAAKLHPENETRLLSLGVIDTKQQTHAVMRILATDKVADFDYAPWQAFQDWLYAGECRVVVPFAPMLADRIPPVAVRLRRDFGMLLSLIRAHALLHRETRDKDRQGRIIAAPADYAGAYHLVEKLFAEGIEVTVPAVVRETVEAVAEYLSEGGSAKTQDGIPTVSLTALAKRLELDKNSVHHRVRKAIGFGHLINLETRKGKPAQIVLGDPLPEEGEILPAPGALECWADIPSETDIPPETPPTLQHSPETPYETNGSGVGSSVGAQEGVGPTALSVGSAVPASNTVLETHSNTLTPCGDNDSDRPLECWSDSRTLDRGKAYTDPFADYPDLPAFLDRRNRVVPDDRRPALGPEGDSLDDLVR